MFPDQTLPLVDLFPPGELSAPVQLLPPVELSQPFTIPTHFGGLVSMLEEGCMTDLAIICQDGPEIRAHRVLLASASDMLKAKFAAGLCDANEDVWLPEVGSADAWTWLVGWVYGRELDLKSDLLVEVLIIADMFQFKRLVELIMELNIASCENNAAMQLLSASHCPEILEKIAARSVPAITIDAIHCAALKKAKLPNAALFMRFVDGLAEFERLRILCSLFLKQDIESGQQGNDQQGKCEFPRCILDAIHWDLFPVSVLKAGLSGDFRCFGAELCGILSSANISPNVLRDILVDALVLRCERLDSDPREFVRQGVVPKKPVPGIFATLSGEGKNFQVSSSSTHASNPMPRALLDPNNGYFGTLDIHAPNNTWIELHTLDVSIRPTAFGLKHGWEDRDYCQSYVIEAAGVDGNWIELHKRLEDPLKAEGQIFPVPMSQSGGRGFSRFRIRMTGPTSSNTNYLMVAWFDVFGFTSQRMLCAEYF